MNNDPIRHLEITLNNVAHFLEFKINALVLVLDKAMPGFSDAYERQLFFSKCLAVMAGSERLRQNPKGDAVAMLQNNAKLIEDLRKQAEEKGLMELFEKAQAEAKRQVAEAKVQEPLTIIKP